MRIFKTLKSGANSVEVTFLQRSLPAWAWPTPVTSAMLDGVFGTTTERAVSNYQSQLDLPVDGIAGPETLSALGIYSKVVAGIDISDYQTNIDWPKVTGLDFCYIKASEGATWRATQFGSHYAGARGQNLRVGAYHFARMGTNTPWAEVANLMSVLRGLPLDLPIALDLEADFGLTGYDALQWALAWLQEVQRTTGVAPVVYTSRRIIIDKLDGGAGLEAYPLWTPRWGPQPVNLAPWANWETWQYTNKGVCPGIPSDVDMNYMAIGV